jgi:hypothetical protein
MRHVGLTGCRVFSYDATERTHSPTSNTKLHFIFFCPRTQGHDDEKYMCDDYWALRSSFVCLRHHILKNETPFFYFI